MTPDLNLDANDLVLFARIMEVGSFSKAAERTGLPILRDKNSAAKCAGVGIFEPKPPPT